MVLYFIWSYCTVSHCYVPLLQRAGELPRSASSHFDKYQSMKYKKIQQENLLGVPGQAVGQSLRALVVEQRCWSFQPLQSARLYTRRHQVQNSVVCTYPMTQIFVPSRYTAGDGTGAILAGNRQCTGGEKTVFDCPLMGQCDSCGCTHAHDQGIACTSPCLAYAHYCV